MHAAVPPPGTNKDGSALERTTQLATLRGHVSGPLACMHRCCVDNSTWLGSRSRSYDMQAKATTQERSREKRDQLPAFLSLPAASSARATTYRSPQLDRARVEGQKPANSQPRAAGARSVQLFPFPAPDFHTRQLASKLSMQRTRGKSLHVRIRPIHSPELAVRSKEFRKLNREVFKYKYKRVCKLLDRSSGTGRNECSSRVHVLALMKEMTRVKTERCSQGARGGIVNA